MTSSLDIISKANVEKSIKGISIKKVDFWIFNRVIKELIPKIIKIFKILLPTTFPIVIWALSWIAATKETEASGRLVPIAQIVKPMTSCGIWK